MSLFLKLQFKKAVRSAATGRKIVGSLFIGFLALLLLSYVLLVGLVLPTIIEEGLGKTNVIGYLNSKLLYFFLIEMLYRFFMQKLVVIDLDSFLHLPIKRSKIVHFLLAKSFISPLNIIAILLFIPTAVTEVTNLYGGSSAISWVGTIVLISWALHWLMLWYKQQYGERIFGVLAVFGIFLAGMGSSYYGWFYAGAFLKPIFTAALNSFFPVFVIAALLFLGLYWLPFNYYYRHAYLEELSTKKDIRIINKSIGFLQQFGLAGIMGDLEWKLIIRHKKSRTFLIISILFLLYGLIFYTDSTLMAEEGVSSITIFIGIFITGIFIFQYGQLLLSWNSAYFEFYLNKQNGLEELLKGKYLLFGLLSLLAFLLSVPYVYFGWQILLVHFVTFLFNLGVNIHFIVQMALWNPKPMDISKGAIFNYEGVGAAQFLMLIPAIAVPYLIYLPFALLLNDYIGLLVLGITGFLGILFHKQLINLAAKRLQKNRYKIAASFRQEL